MSRDDTTDSSQKQPRPDTEVAAKPTRRRFTAEYKLRILEEIDAASPGEQGAILRREGLYSSHISDWRQARRNGALKSLSRKRGRKPKADDAQARRIAELEREVARLERELSKARLIVEVQGKVAGLLGIDLQSGRSS